nr:MAG: putative RNA-dependent RNA polymerase [Botourmiaviridae sp.]
MLRRTPERAAVAPRMKQGEYRWIALAFARAPLRSKRVLSAPRKSTGGGGENCLLCRKAVQKTKAVVSTGLRLIRVRFGIAPGESLIEDPGRLTDYLSFLQQSGSERPSCCFPRRQGRPDGEGLVALIRLGRKERWEFALSVASLKRSLPTGCVVHLPSSYAKWAERRFSPQPPPDPQYVTFCLSQLRTLFSHGWDRSYRSRCANFMPNATSRHGPRRADLWWRGRREQFLRAVYRGEAVPDVLSGEYREVPSAGKLRPLLVPDVAGDLLGPLHDTLYDMLRRTPWLLIGPPTEDRINHLCEGRRWFTSIDLVNATDGLNLTISRAILEIAQDTASYVPPEIIDFALSSLGMMVDGKMVQFGQMMGTYTSFPLLCIHSWLAALWASRHCVDARILVNGDDCLVATDEPLGLYPPGYELNEKKTVRSSSVVEINSTVFLKRGGRFREVRNLRRGGFDPSSYSGMLHGAEACRILGASWVNAWVHSRIGRRWGFLPSQLGLLESRSWAAFARQRVMVQRRCHTSLPGRAEVRDDRLEVRRGEPATDEVAALVHHVWKYGRGGKKREAPFEVSVGKVRRSYLYRDNSSRINQLAARALGFRTSLSWEVHLAGLGLPGRQRPLTYVVPSAYVSDGEVARAGYRPDMFPDCFFSWDLSVSVD